MKCDELKDYDYDPDFPFQSRGRFYVADEVEAAIDELKAAHHKERHEYIEMVAQLKAKLAEQEDNILNKKKINAFDCICGNEIRAQLEKNDRTQKEGQMRALMEQMQRLTK